MWDRPFIYAELQSHYESSLFPVVLDFSNAATGYSELEFEESTTLSTSLANQWSLAGGFGIQGSVSESSSTVVTKGAGSGIGTSAGKLDWGADYWVSGTVAFSAISREWAHASVNLYGAPISHNYAEVYSIAAPSDWLTPANISRVTDTYYLTGFNGLVVHGVVVPPATYDYGYITTSTTAAASTTYSVGFGLSYGLEGVVPLSVGFEMGWSQTSSTTSSGTLYWQAGGTGTSQYTCYNVYGQGGTFGSPVSTADMVGIYSWAATYYSSNATWGCP